MKKFLKQKKINSYNKFKIHRFEPDLNPRPLDPLAGTLPMRHPDRPYIIMIIVIMTIPKEVIEAHYPTFPSLHLRRTSLSNPSVALPTSQLILQPFRCFTYVTGHSPILLSLFLRHSLFTYVTWRAAHA